MSGCGNAPAITGKAMPIRDYEAAIELTYQIQLAMNWSVQPDLQYIINPGGGVLNPDGSLRRNALVIGVRSSLNF